MTTQLLAADKIPSNLKALRNRLGLTQTEIAPRVGMNQQTYSKYEAGDLRLRVDMLPGFAAALECDVYEILEGIEDRTVSLAGAVTPGGAIVPLDAVNWTGSRTVDAPRDMRPSETEAYVIIDDALLPVDAGSVIFARKPSEVDPAQIVNRLCIVELADGRRMVKQVRRGYTRGHFNLVSNNAAPIEDAQIVLASVVRSIQAPSVARGAAA